MTTPRQRADRLFVDRGLFESRAKAQAAIEAGLVTADERTVLKPSEQIPTDAELRASPAHPGFDPKNRICLDVGVSTGGFTQVLLARGARRIYAVDVGTNQLHQRLRTRPEVVSLDATDIRKLSRDDIGEPPDFVSIDVSFISLKLTLPSALGLAKPPAHLVALIKPQFEAGPGATKKGIVRDATTQEATCDDIANLATSLGWRVLGVIPSPILGGDGNAEFLLGAIRD